MSLRVVLYAEGAGELGRGLALPPAPGWPLEEERLGPAHVIARRSLERVRKVPVQAIQFEQGKRKRNTNEARGSDLLRKRTLLDLLAWPREDMRPEMAIVIVDEDGLRTRHRELKEWVAELRYGRPPTVIAVAREEFEAWLITDRSCVEEELGRPLGKAGKPEVWEPKVAKQVLQRAIDESCGSDKARAHALRRAICERCDLDVLERGSGSFRCFLEDLKAP